MKKILSLLISLMLLLSILPATVAEENLTRAKAAVMLDDLFALADVHPMNIPEFETTPRNLGYSATNGAIVSANVVAAAKDCVSYETQPQIEAVINSGLMELDTDNLSFRPSKPVTAKEFALSIAMGLYGANLDIDHMALALADGVFAQEQLTDDVLTVETAQAMVDELAEKLQIVAVFATSDIHGNYIPYTSADGNFKIGSVARIKTIMDEVRAEIGKENVFYVDGGDSPYNTTLANITLGDVSVAALNALELDATVLGNHDYDYSFENLLRLAENAEYAMLSANTKYKEGHQPEGVDSLYPKQLGDYITREAAGLKFGIFGCTDDASAATTLYANTADITWDEDLAKCADVVATLRDVEKCDLIIALSHLHSKNAALVLQEKDIDISIGGGNDIAGRPTILGDNQYLVNPGKHGEAVTQINVNVLNGKVSGFVYNQLFLTDAYAENAEVKAIVDEYNAQVDAALETTIGYLAEDLPWSTELVRFQNSPIANLVTDALLAYFKNDGAQLCIVNGGGIRAKLDAGEISIREVTSVLPFDNNMMLVEASGQTVWNALQNGISAWPASNGKFPQVAGMTYSFKPAETGNTLTSVTLTDGSPLDMNARYKVVINSFLAGGGDGYTMFNLLDTSKEMADDAKQLVHVNKTYMRDALQAYMEANSTAETPISIDMEEVRILIEQ
ncbi:MAG: bifunctional UDP-sugar hydrolase/5'-nucleotidase [Eubacteriales bacterium]|nr:bifunctional UDP-sugar hydrolase/5'-nucleotidase [Eubacteriales bacterium]